MSQYETPLFTGLKEHAKKDPVQFHIPGHKKGAGIDPEFRSFIGESALSIDLINIGPLDDLHSPKGMIKKPRNSQQKHSELIIHSSLCRARAEPS